MRETWRVQGLHASSSDIEVEAMDVFPVAGRLDEGPVVTVEVLYAGCAYLFPEQARHLASVLMRAADAAESS